MSTVIVKTANNDAVRKIEKLDVEVSPAGIRITAHRDTGELRFDLDEEDSKRLAEMARDWLDAREVNPTPPAQWSPV
jgi:hypothetical protein